MCLFIFVKPLMENMFQVFIICSWTSDTGGLRLKIIRKKLSVEKNYVVTLFAGSYNNLTKLLHKSQQIKEL